MNAIGKKTALPKPGETIELAGIQFAVLEASESELFILTVTPQGECRFGGNNNYNGSMLEKSVGDWLYRFTEKLTMTTGLNCDIGINSRTLDLTTVKGYKEYCSPSVSAAPLTMDETRKYAGLIPAPSKTCWTATGWDKGHVNVLCIGANNDWREGFSEEFFGFRPALVISPALLYLEDVDDPMEDSKVLLLKRLCFECSLRNCSYNHNSRCRFALVHERRPKSDNVGGCADFIDDGIPY